MTLSQRAEINQCPVNEIPICPNNLSVENETIAAERRRFGERVACLERRINKMNATDRRDKNVVNQAIAFLAGRICGALFLVDVQLTHVVEANAMGLPTVTKRLLLANHRRPTFDLAPGADDFHRDRSMSIDCER